MLGNKRSSSVDRLTEAKYYFNSENISESIRQ